MLLGSSGTVVCRVDQPEALTRLVRRRQGLAPDSCPFLPGVASSGADDLVLPGCRGSLSRLEVVTHMGSISLVVESRGSGAVLHLLSKRLMREPLGAGGLTLLQQGQAFSSPGGDEVFLVWLP